MASSGGFSNVIICDDHYVSALGIEALIRGYSQNTLQIRVASTGKMALEFFRQNAPDLFVVDLGLPDMSGFEVIKQVRVSSPASRVIVLTGQSDPLVLQQVLGLNVAGILRKMNTGLNLSEALSFMKESPDKTYLDSSVERILQSTSDQTVTPREYEVLELMAQGHTTEEIAKRMNCAVTTVKTYRARIMNRSGVRNSAEMIAWFLKRNGKTDFGPDSWAR